MSTQRIDLPRMVLAALGTAFAIGAGAAQLAARATDLPTWRAGCWTGRIGGEEVHERWIVGD